MIVMTQSESQTHLLNCGLVRPATACPTLTLEAVASIPPVVCLPTPATATTQAPEYKLPGLPLRPWSLTRSQYTLNKWVNEQLNHHPRILKT